MRRRPVAARICSVASGRAAALESRACIPPTPTPTFTPSVCVLSCRPLSYLSLSYVHFNLGTPSAVCSSCLKKKENGYLSDLLKFLKCHFQLPLEKQPFYMEGVNMCVYIDLLEGLWRCYNLAPLLSSIWVGRDIVISCCLARCSLKVTHLPASHPMLFYSLGDSFQRSSFFLASSHINSKAWLYFLIEFIDEYAICDLF